MKYSGMFILLTAALSAILAVGCGRTGGTEENLFQIPWPNEEGGYSLQAVSIRSFDEPHTLQGRFARIFVNPFTRHGQLESDKPVGRFIRSKGGVNIPADYTSLQATVVHAHFERLQKMDQDLGVQLEWPVKVGIRSKVRDRSGLVQNNAIFDGRLDALLIVPYTADGLPIAVNAGILAHEHFHMIFQNAVVSRVRFKRKERLGLSQKVCEWGAHGQRHSHPSSIADESTEVNAAEDPTLYPSLFNEFKLRALNEGLADFWAWVYTGDVDFIGSSLPSESKYRRLDFKVRQMLGRESVKNLVFRPEGKPYNDRILGGNAYRLGTTYARLLRELATTGSDENKKPSFEDRLKAANAVVKALPSIASAIASAEKSDAYVSANAFLKPIYENWPNKNGDVCRIFQRIAAPDHESDGFGEDLKCPKSNIEISPQEGDSTTPPVLVPPAKVTL